MGMQKLRSLILPDSRLGEKMILTGDFRTHLEEGDIYVQLKRGDQIIYRSGRRTMEEVVTMLKEMYNRSGSVSNLSGKLNRGTLRYQEAKEIADVLDYDIIWVKRR